MSLFNNLPSPLLSKACSILTLTLFAVTVGAPIANADFVFTHSGTLTADFTPPASDPGPGDPQDTLGLNGASFTFSATFSDDINAIYNPGSSTSAPEAPSISTLSSLTISGASITSTNGTYILGDFITMTAGTGEGAMGQGFLDTSRNPIWAINGQFFELPTSQYRGGSTTAQAEFPETSDSPKLADFPTELASGTNSVVRTGLDENFLISEFAISNQSFAVTTTAVPEPSAFLCVGLIGLGFARRKKHRAMHS